MRTVEVLLAAIAATWVVAADPTSDPRKEISPAPAARRPAAKPADQVSPRERWKLFREHMEAAGRKDVLPEASGDGRPPAGDPIAGVLFRTTSAIAAADDLLGKEPPDVAGARARLKDLDGASDPYVADYARLYSARCDLYEKKYPEAAAGFEKLLDSARNMAATAAHRGLCECYRASGEATLEVLELSFLLKDLSQESIADRSWAEARLAEIRKDHAGPLEDSQKRIEDVSDRLVKAEGPEAIRKDQAKVEEILIKTAKLLEDEAEAARMAEQSSAQKSASGGKKRTGQGQRMAGNQKDGRGAKGDKDGKGQKDGKDGKAGKKGAKGEPTGPGKANAADASQIGKGGAGPKNLKESEAKDSDAWGKANERDVAKSLQDLWGKVPPGYRRLVAQYFKDISGLEPEPAPPVPPAGNGGK